jgi:hypothetical protein
MSQPGPVRQGGEIDIALVEVRVGIQCGCSGEQCGVARDEQQRLLAAHGAAGCIDPLSIDLHPRERAANQTGQARQVVDVAGRAPRVEAEPSSFLGGIDDRERVSAGKITPVALVDPWIDSATVGRDDERDRWVVVRAVPRGEHQVGRPDSSGPRSVVEGHRADERA